MNTTLTFTTGFVATTCGECGVPFAMTDEYHAKKKENGTPFYCPNGHCRVYRDTDLMRERRARELAESSLVAERARHDQTRAAKEAAERREIAQRAAKTRIKNRVARGVCPCCNRTFDNLARHMETKHKGYAKTED